MNHEHHTTSRPAPHWPSEGADVPWYAAHHDPRPSWTPPAGNAWAFSSARAHEARKLEPATGKPEPRRISALARPVAPEPTVAASPVPPPPEPVISSLQAPAPSVAVAQDPVTRSDDRLDVARALASLHLLSAAAALTIEDTPLRRLAPAETYDRPDAIEGIESPPTPANAIELTPPSVHELVEEAAQLDSTVAPGPEPAAQAAPAAFSALESVEALAVLELHADLQAQGFDVHAAACCGMGESPALQPQPVPASPTETPSQIMAIEPEGVMASPAAPGPEAKSPSQLLAIQSEPAVESSPTPAPVIETPSQHLTIEPEAALESLAVPAAAMEPAAQEIAQEIPQEIKAPPVFPEPDPRWVPAEPRIIAVMNQKGGVGKTTSAVNLGAALCRMGLRVLMIDLDPQGHMTLHLGLEPDALPLSVYDLLTQPRLSASEVLCPLHSHMAVLPSEVNLAGAETELSSRMATGVAQRLLRDKVAPLLAPRNDGRGGITRDFDYVLIDCPPSLGLLTINALTLAQEVLVPMQAHFLALQGLSKLLETVGLIRQAFNPALRVAGMILCMHDRQTILAQEIIADLRSFLESAQGQGMPWSDAAVFEPAVRRNIKLAESPSFGQTIFEYAPDSNGAHDYRELARSLVERHAAAR